MEMVYQERQVLAARVRAFVDFTAKAVEGKLDSPVSPALTMCTS
jgi:hypothetical protein